MQEYIEQSVHGGIGDNSQDLTLSVEVRLFNAVARQVGGGGSRRHLTLPVGTTVGELADRIGIPRRAVHLVLVNGRDVTPGLVGAAFKDYHQIQDGDVVAFSGPVPYSYGYGAPVV